MMSTFRKRIRIEDAKVSASTEVLEKTVYLRMNTSGSFHSNEIEWYQVNLSNKDGDYDESDNNYDPERKRKRKRKKGKGKQKPPPLPPPPIDPISKTSLPGLNCPCVTLGSTIYAIVDGCSIWSVEADQIPIAGRPWKELTKICKSKRRVSQAVALEDNIYIFGASIEPRLCSLTVVHIFDPSVNTIEELRISPVFLRFPDDPSHSQLIFPPDKGFFAVADPSHHRIIVGSFVTGVLLAYRVRHGDFEILDRYFDTWSGVTLSHPVLFDNILYWIWRVERSSGIYAYDLDRNIFRRGPIIYLPDIFYDNSSFPPILFHFCADEFYLLWIQEAEDGQHSLLRCTRLRVSWITVDDLRAYTLSEQTYLLDRRSALMDGVVQKNEDGRIISDDGIDRPSFSSETREVSPTFTSQVGRSSSKTQENAASLPGKEEDSSLPHAEI